MIRLLTAGLLFFSFTAIPQTFPQGFSQAKVGTVYYPTAMAKTPDGRIFICEKGGRVKVFKNGAILSTPFVQVSVVEQNEQGLGGIAIDPQFSTNGYVYLYYTTGNPTRNRLARYTASGDVAASGSGTTLVEFETVVNSIHNGGGMAFGPDGKLYLGMGDDHVSSNAQSLNTHKGKVLRMNRDGSPATGNPYSGSTTTSRIWAIGLRNPFSLDIQPGTGKLFVNDVGEGAWEEINNATQSGKNFGWPGTEGYTSNSSYTSPFYAYAHGETNLTGCGISGGAFFNPTSTNYPSQYAGKYFFVDYCNKWMNYIDPNGGNAVNFASNLGGAPVGVLGGPDGNLYYLSISQSGLYKIIYSGGGSAPAITQQPMSQTVSAGQPVVFTVGASGSTPLSYQWYKNNVAISGANSATYSISSAQTTHQGTYKATVSNSYGTATSANANLTVGAFNAQPVASISSPAPGTTYRGGDVITYSGTATDSEDGTLAASNFSWTINFHHENHIHPGPSGATGAKSGSFLIPQTGESSANVWYRIILIVKDSQNRTDTVYRDVYPKTSRITFQSSPPGLQVAFEGQPSTTTFSRMAVENLRFSIEAPSPQTMNGTNYQFSAWSQGGAASQTITIPEADAVYTASFISTGTSTGNVSCSATGNISREVWVNVPGVRVSDIPVSAAPSFTGTLTLFKSVSNSGDNYGERLRGFICPPATGNYTFWITSDDHSELWLSTDHNPANRQRIAYVEGWTASGEYTKYASQKSAAVNLQAGGKYYIEALHKEGTQGDNLAVGWALPSGVLERPIPGTRLSEFSNARVVSITSPANNSTFNTSANIAIAASSSGGTGSVTKMQFYQGSTLLGEDFSSPYSYTWNAVPAGTYTLTARAMDSNGGQTTSSGIRVTVGSQSGCTGAGSITREVWQNVSGSSVSQIPVGSTPSIRENITSFESPTEVADNYGQRIRGYVCPPYTGNYIFYIASDDNSELWLSTGESSTGKQLIASVSGWTLPREWGKYPSQKSAEIQLTAGQKYYIEALHKEGVQGDHVSVAWRMPNSVMEAPIAGQRLIPAMQASLAVCGASVQPGGSTTFCQGGSVKLFANTGAGYTYQWKKDGVNITGATTYSYQTSNSGDYQVRITYTGCQAWSAPTRVTVNDYLTARITPGGPTTFCSGQSVMLYGNYCDGYVYQWKRNGNDIPGANDRNYLASQPGSYQLKIVSGSSISWSALVEVTENNCAGRTVENDSTLNEESAMMQPGRMAVDEATQRPQPEPFNLKLYPNPTTGAFTFDYCLEDASNTVLFIQVVNANTGQVVYEKPAVRVEGCVKENIELSSTLQSGVYVLKLQMENKTESVKLILYR
jgi:glucose/arabinose dehydrogenase